MSTSPLQHEAFIFPDPAGARSFATALKVAREHARELGDDRCPSGERELLGALLAETQVELRKAKVDGRVVHVRFELDDDSFVYADEDRAAAGRPRSARADLEAAFAALVRANAGVPFREELDAPAEAPSVADRLRRLIGA